jgi:hypothetical protein
MFIHINFILVLDHTPKPLAMSMIRSSAVIFIFLIAFSCAVKTEVQDSSAKDTLTYKVEPAPEWTALFNRTQGWFGGDGIFAIPFSGKDASTSVSDSILFLFSDTMVGEIENNKLKPGYVMVNNSVMILHGKDPAAENADFLIHKDKQQKPATLFIPQSANKQKEDYYWLGDGFVNHGMDSSLCLFAYRIRNTNDNSAFPFREVGNNLIIIPKGSKYPFTEQRHLDLPFSEGKDSLATSFGVGILANTSAAGVSNADEYVYVYGVRGRAKELVASRVKPSQLADFAAWEFYTGSGWTAKPEEAQAIADSVSNELSVTPLGNNKFALIYQYGGLMPTICMQIGDSPVGPFGPREKVWNTASDVKEKDLFAYNAKAHPAISKPGELLVSYNVNSFNFFKQIEEIPNLYRPRFVRIVFNTSAEAK